MKIGDLVIPKARDEVHLYYPSYEGKVGVIIDQLNLISRSSGYGWWVQFGDNERRDYYGLDLQQIELE